MNLLDQVIAYCAPRAALERLAARHALRLYDAAERRPQDKPRQDRRSANAVMDHARDKIRMRARHADENNELAVGVLDCLVDRIVGPGIHIEPMVRSPDGSLHEEANSRLRELWADWSRYPETRQALPWGEAQRLACRTWLRDGEMLTQHIEGARAATFGKPVPYVIELIEPDYLPFEYSSTRPRIRHGVQLDDWGRALLYHVYLEHPGEVMAYTRPAVGTVSSLLVGQTKAVPAAIMTHLKFTRRCDQVRGVSILHASLRALDDVHDAWESERVAMRVAAAFCAFIRRPDAAGGINSGSGQRELEMTPGMIFDQLLPGEEISTIDSKRPNTAFADFTRAILRAVAAGTGANYSTIARDYSGSYSSQRQEMVESSVIYARLRNQFVQVWVREIYERFARLALASGALQLRAREYRASTLTAADYRGPAMGWIDPLKEVQAHREAVEAGFSSRHQVIRTMGGDPSAVDAELEADPLDARAEAPDGNTPEAGAPVPSDAIDTEAVTDDAA